LEWGVERVMFKDTTEIKVAYQETEHHTVGSISDFGASLAEAALAKPYNASAGLVLPKMHLGIDYDHNSWAAKAGEFGAGVIDLVALTKMSSWGISRGLSLTGDSAIASAYSQSRMLSSSLSLGTAGALHGGVFTSGDADTRLKNAVVEAGTFAVMGASTAGLGRLAFLGKEGSRTLLQDAALGGLSGLPGGVANVELTSLMNGKGLNLDANTVGSSALYYGLFGATIGGVMHGLSRATESGSKPGAQEPAAAETQNRVEPGGQLKGARTEADVAIKIPETGFVELGQLMRQTPFENQIGLVQKVLTVRPDVPLGSWMRLVAPEDMPQFLRAVDQLHPEYGFRHATDLIRAEYLRPAAPDSQPIDFGAWRKALETVQTERLRGLLAVPIEKNLPEKPFTYDDVTMTVRDPALMKDSIAKHSDLEGTNHALVFANEWATRMEARLAAGEPMSVDMIRRAEGSVEASAPGHPIYALARKILVDNWVHGSKLDQLIRPDGLSVNEAIRIRAGASPVELTLTVAQQAELNNAGSMLMAVTNSRAEAIDLVRAADPSKVDPAVQTVLLDELLLGKDFLRQFGVDATESNASIIGAMPRVPSADIPRFVHYADQFHSGQWSDSLMSAMDKAIARGDVAAGTQQAWVDVLAAKLRVVFSGIKESDWAISKLPQRG